MGGNSLNFIFFLVIIFFFNLFIASMVSGSRVNFYYVEFILIWRCGTMKKKGVLYPYNTPKLIGSALSVDRKNLIDRSDRLLIEKKVDRSLEH